MTRFYEIPTVLKLDTEHLSQLQKVHQSSVFPTFFTFKYGVSDS